MLSTAMCASNVVLVPVDIASYCGAYYYVPQCVAPVATAMMHPQYCYTTIPTATVSQSQAPHQAAPYAAPAAWEEHHVGRVFSSLSTTCRYLSLPKCDSLPEPVASTTGVDLYLAQCAQYVTPSMMRHLITELCGISPQSVRKAPMNAFFVTMATAADALRAVELLHHRVAFDNEGVWYDAGSRGTPTSQGPLQHWESVTRTEVHVPHLPRRRMIAAIRRSNAALAQ